MSDTLRSAAIRLAHRNRNIRSKLLPLLAGVLPAPPGEESWQAGEPTPNGWAPGYLTEHGEGHGEGSQTPPARDEDGKLLPIKEAAGPISQIEIQPIQAGRVDHVRVSIYDSKGKQHNDLPLKNLPAYLTKVLMVSSRRAREITELLGNQDRVRVERRGDEWGSIQVIRKATWENKRDLQRRASLYRHLERASLGTPSLQGRIAALINARAQMSEGTFWKVVSEIGWGNSSDNNRIKKRLLALWTPEQAEAARGTFSKLKGRLYNRVDDWSREEVEQEDRNLGLGDDSFDDLLSHIIGLGKREYDAVMRDPSLAQDRALKGDYKESFSYALPWKEDYENLNISKYVKWAKGLVDEYTEQMSNPVLKPLQRKIQRMIRILRILAVNRDWSGFLQTQDEGFPLSEEIAQKGAKLLRAAQDPHEFAPLDGGNPINNKWAVWNLYTDIRDYLA
jgi:hypothetical protein